MPISTKLNLLILALPISSIVSIFLVGFYFYRESFDASAFSTAVSSLTSAILVILLVWERLRDSLSKKLEYLHKNFIFKLYYQFRSPSLFYTQNDILLLRSDLDRYAKFLGLRLYPRNLLKEIHEFLASHHEFFMRYQKIEELARERLHLKNPVELHGDLLQDYLGLIPSYRSPHYTPTEETLYEGLSQNITKENSLLMSETKEYLQKARELAARIFSKLEDFLKSNNLKLEQESTSLWS